MTTRAYVNEDGSVKAEILAGQKNELDQSAQCHGVNQQRVDELLAQVDTDGYVIIPDLISAEVIECIRTETQALLTHDGRSEFEGFNTRRIYSVIEKPCRAMSWLIIR